MSVVWMQWSFYSQLVIFSESRSICMQIEKTLNGALCQFMIFFAVLMCVDVFIYGIIKIRAIINNKTQMTINHKKIITTWKYTAIYKCMYIRRIITTAINIPQTNNETILCCWSSHKISIELNELRKEKCVKVRLSLCSYL